MLRMHNFEKFGRTYKSIGVEEIVDDALHNEVDTISVISSGNFLASIRSEVQKRGLTGLSVLNLVNKKTRRGGELRMPKKRILRDANEREGYVMKTAPEKGKVKDYTNFIPQALEIEIEKILSTNPEYVALGVGSGKLFTTIAKKIKEKGLVTKLIGFVPRGENGIFNDKRVYENKKGHLKTKQFKYRSVADKLSTPYTWFKENIKAAIIDGHIVCEANNSDFKKAYKKAKGLGEVCEISGSAGFIALSDKFKERYNIEENSNIVVLNTGQGDKKNNVIRIESKPISYLKKAAVAASIFLSIWGVNKGIEQYKWNNLVRHSAMTTAKIAAGKIGDDQNLSKFSTEELWKYITDADEKIGGPTHYWL